MSIIRYAKDGLTWPDDFINKVICGDCLTVLSNIPDQIIQTCITSPPYWGLRDYGVDGQLGLEKTPEEYVEKMVAVFREVRRVLKDDGTLWLNLGDSYNGSGGDHKINGKNDASFQTDLRRGSQSRKLNTLKPKDLVGIPWMVAFALRKDGWYLRSDIIWSKPNPMPESVTDRPTKAHEYIFLMAKSQKYYYNHEAIKEPSTGQDGLAGNFARATKDHVIPGQSVAQHRLDRLPTADNGNRNKRSVWEIATQPHPFAHFATFPTKLIDPCILAGSAKGDMILDPFFGSGTVGLRAKELGRKYVGLELNPEYIKIAEQRLAQKELF